MLIYHTHHNTSSNSNFENKTEKYIAKNQKKKYKIARKQKPAIIRTKVLEQEGRKNCKVKKKLSKKNVKFLEGLGLKVKQND